MFDSTQFANAVDACTNVYTATQHRDMDTHFIIHRTIGLTGYIVNYWVMDYRTNGRME